MMASARYSHLANDNPANDILPSFVMYTCQLFVILSLWSGEKDNIMSMNDSRVSYMNIFKLISDIFMMTKTVCYMENFHEKPGNLC